jgi:hypothetical protein
MDQNWKPAGLEPDPFLDEIALESASVQRAGRRRGRAAVFGALVLGGIAGAAIFGPLSAFAASPSPSAATSPSTTTASGTAGNGDHPAGICTGMGGHHETIGDASVVAKAIGMTEADLKTALSSGQTIAAVAKAHNVSVQVVIDALVADEKTELAAAVKAGTITQAQADARTTNLVQRITDRVNGTFMGGPHS